MISAVVRVAEHDQEADQGCVWEQEVEGSSMGEARKEWAGLKRGQDHTESMAKYDIYWCCWVEDGGAGVENRRVEVL